MSVPNYVFSAFRDKIMFFISFKQFIYKYFDVWYIFYTIIIPKKRKQDLKLNYSNKLLPSYLKKESLGNILFNMGIATYKELVKAKKPVRLIYLDDDSIYPAVKLMAFLMLEVPVIGKLLRINPFDQPAVEKVKVLTKKLLSKNGKN